MNFGGWKLDDEGRRCPFRVYEHVILENYNH